LSPFSTPFAEASNNNDRQVIGPDGASIKSRAGFSPLAIEDVWYVQIDSGKTAGMPDGSQAIDLVVLVSNPLDGSRAVDDAVKKARTRISEFKSELAEAERSEKEVESEKRSRREPEIAEKVVEKPSVWLLGEPESGKAEKATVDREDDNGPKRRFFKSNKLKDQVEPEEPDSSNRLL
jgi:hypothetical protein